MTIYDRRRWLRPQALVLLTCLAMTVYFAFHAISGKHGFEARSKLLTRSATLSRELEGLEAVRVRLNHEVAALAGPDPDPDYVSELAADLLGFAVAGDFLVVTDTK